MAKRKKYPKLPNGYGRIKHTELSEEKKPTFAEVYEQFYDYKFNRDKSRKYSRSTQDCIRATYKNCTGLYDVPFCDLRHKHLQDTIDNCPLKHATLEHILSLMHQMYRYAIAYDIVDKDCSSALQDIGIDRHTPHHCRHTFSRLCEKYQVKENDRKRMLGHSFADITNKVYGHREIEDLRKEIEKIKICY